MLKGPRPLLAGDLLTGEATAKFVESFQRRQREAADELGAIDLASTPLCTAPADGPYLDVEIPERFVVQFFERGTWWAEGLSTRAHVATGDDGAIRIGFGPGVPVIIRCVEEHADHFVTVDGGGDRWLCRLVAVDENDGDRGPGQSDDVGA